MDGIDKIDDFGQDERDDMFSKTIRAGKRTYFLDVKSTRKNDYYLTITESKRRYEESGRFYFEKHKLFLYKEDFDKFTDGLIETINYIKENLLAKSEEKPDKPEVLDTSESQVEKEIVNINFEDLSD